MLVCFDTEYDARYTDRGIGRLSCMTYSIDDGPAEIVGYRDAVKLWVGWAQDESVRFLGHSSYHDHATLADEAHLHFEGELSEAPGVGPYWELAHALYDKKRNEDTEISQRFTHIRFGPHKASVQLGALAKQVLGIDMGAEKTIPAEARALLASAIPYDEWPQDVLQQTPWRVKFGMLRELHGHDVSKFPQDAVSYALEDARLPWRLLAHQRQRWGGKPIPNLQEQIANSWMLHLVSLPGWCADRERAQAIRKIYRRTIADCERTLLAVRVLEIDGPRPVQKQDKLKALVFAALGAQTPVSKTAEAAAKERGSEPTLDERRESAATDAKTCAKAIAASGGPTLGTTPKKSAASFENALAELGAELTQSQPWTTLYAHWLRGKTQAVLKKDDDRASVQALDAACHGVLVDAGVLEIVTKRTIKTKRVAERVYSLLGDDSSMTDKGYELYGGAATDEQRLEYCSKDAKALRAAILNKPATPLNIADAVEASENGAESFDAWLRGSGEDVLNAVAVRSKADKTIVNFLDKLDTDRRIRTSYTTIVDTGRTSARGAGQPGTLNIQQLPRDYDKPKHLHSRGCIIPPLGWAFVVADYTQLELCALAHILTNLVRFYARNPRRKAQAERRLGFSISKDYTSTLARAINNDQDCHVRMAAVLRSSTYAACIEIYKRAEAKKERGETLTAVEKRMVEDRQLAKPCNFGFPGGLGALAFVDYAAGYGISITPEIAARAKAAYMAAWPEMKLYFWHIKQAILKSEADGWYGGVCKQVRSGRLRGDCTLTQWANGWFQGLAADGAKYAGRLLVNAAYREPESPMFGTRPSGFVHDEYLTNARVEQAESALPEQERLMVKGMRVWIPDVKIKAPGKVLYERWGK